MSSSSSSSSINLHQYAIIVGDNVSYNSIDDIANGVKYSPDVNSQLDIIDDPNQVLGDNNKSVVLPYISNFKVMHRLSQSLLCYSSNNVTSKCTIDIFRYSSDDDGSILSNTSSSNKYNKNCTRNCTPLDLNLYGTIQLPCLLSIILSVECYNAFLLISTSATTSNLMFIDLFGNHINTVTLKINNVVCADIDQNRKELVMGLSDGTIMSHAIRLIPIKKTDNKVDSNPDTNIITVTGSFAINKRIHNDEFQFSGGTFHSLFRSVKDFKSHHYSGNSCLEIHTQDITQATLMLSNTGSIVCIDTSTLELYWYIDKENFLQLPIHIYPDKFGSDFVLLCKTNRLEYWSPPAVYAMWDASQFNRAVIPTSSSGHVISVSIEYINSSIGPVIILVSSNRIIQLWKPNLESDKTLVLQASIAVSGYVGSFDSPLAKASSSGLSYFVNSIDYPLGLLVTSSLDICLINIHLPSAIDTDYKAKLSDITSEQVHIDKIAEKLGESQVLVGAKMMDGAHDLVKKFMDRDAYIKQDKLMQQRILKDKQDYDHSNNDTVRVEIPLDDDISERAQSRQSTAQENVIRMISSEIYSSSSSSSSSGSKNMKTVTYSGSSYNAYSSADITPTGAGVDKTPRIFYFTPGYMFPGYDDVDIDLSSSDGLLKLLTPPSSLLMFNPLIKKDGMRKMSSTVATSSNSSSSSKEIALNTLSKKRNDAEEKHTMQLLTRNGFADYYSPPLDLSSTALSIMHAAVAFRAGVLCVVTSLRECFVFDSKASQLGSYNSPLRLEIQIRPNAMVSSIAIADVCLKLNTANVHSTKQKHEQCTYGSNVIVFYGDSDGNVTYTLCSKTAAVQSGSFKAHSCALACILTTGDCCKPLWRVGTTVVPEVSQVSKSRRDKASSSISDSSNVLPTSIPGSGIVTIAKDGEVKVWQPVFTVTSSNTRYSNEQVLNVYTIEWHMTGIYSTNSNKSRGNVTAATLDPTSTAVVIGYQSGQLSQWTLPGIVDTGIEGLGTCRDSLYSIKMHTNCIKDMRLFVQSNDTEVHDIKIDSDDDKDEYSRVRYACIIKLGNHSMKTSTAGYTMSQLKDLTSTSSLVTSSLDNSILLWKYSISIYSNHIVNPSDITRMHYLQLTACRRFSFSSSPSMGLCHSLLSIDSIKQGPASIWSIDVIVNGSLLRVLTGARKKLFRDLIGTDSGTSISSVSSSQSISIPVTVGIGTGVSLMLPCICNVMLASKACEAMSKRPPGGQGLSWLVMKSWNRSTATTTAVVSYPQSYGPIDNDDMTAIGMVGDAHVTATIAGVNKVTMSLDPSIISKIDDGRVCDGKVKILQNGIRMTATVGVPTTVPNAYVDVSSAAISIDNNDYTLDDILFAVPPAIAHEPISHEPNVIPDIISIPSIDDNFSDDDDDANSLNLGSPATKTRPVKSAITAATAKAAASTITVVDTAIISTSITAGVANNSSSKTKVVSKVLANVKQTKAQILRSVSTSILLKIPKKSSAAATTYLSKSSLVKSSNASMTTDNGHRQKNGNAVLFAPPVNYNATQIEKAKNKYIVSDHLGDMGNSISGDLQQVSMTDSTVCDDVNILNSGKADGSNTGNNMYDLESPSIIYKSISLLGISIDDTDQIVLDKTDKFAAIGTYFNRKGKPIYYKHKKPVKKYVSRYKADDDSIASLGSLAENLSIGELEEYNIILSIIKGDDREVFDSFDHETRLDILSNMRAQLIGSTDDATADATNGDAITGNATTDATAEQMYGQSVVTDASTFVDVENVAADGNTIDTTECVSAPLPIMSDPRMASSKPQSHQLRPHSAELSKKPMNSIARLNRLKTIVAVMGNKGCSSLVASLLKKKSILPTLTTTLIAVDERDIKVTLLSAYNGKAIVFVLLHYEGDPDTDVDAFIQPTVTKCANIDMIRATYDNLIALKEIALEENEEVTVSLDGLKPESTYRVYAVITCEGQKDGRDFGLMEDAAFLSTELMVHTSDEQLDLEWGRLTSVMQSIELKAVVRCVAMQRLAAREKPIVLLPNDSEIDTYIDNSTSKGGKMSKEVKATVSKVESFVTWWLGTADGRYFGYTSPRCAFMFVECAYAMKSSAVLAEYSQEGGSPAEIQYLQVISSKVVATTVEDEVGGALDNKYFKRFRSWYKAGQTLLNFFDSKAATATTTTTTTTTTDDTATANDATAVIDSASSTVSSSNEQSVDGTTAEKGCVDDERVAYINSRLENRTNLLVELTKAVDLCIKRVQVLVDLHKEAEKKKLTESDLRSRRGDLSTKDVDNIMASKKLIELCIAGKYITTKLDTKLIDKGKISIQSIACADLFGINDIEISRPDEAPPPDCQYLPGTRRRPLKPWVTMTEEERRMEVCLASALDSIFELAIIDSVAVPDPEDITVDAKSFPFRLHRWKVFTSWYVGSETTAGAIPTLARVVFSEQWESLYINSDSKVLDILKKMTGTIGVGLTGVTQRRNYAKRDDVSMATSTDNGDDDDESSINTDANSATTATASKATTALPENSDSMVSSTQNSSTVVADDGDISDDEDHYIGNANGEVSKSPIVMLYENNINTRAVIQLRFDLLRKAIDAVMGSRRRSMLRIMCPPGGARYSHQYIFTRLGLVVPKIEVPAKRYRLYTSRTLDSWNRSEILSWYTTDELDEDDIAMQKAELHARSQAAYLEWLTHEEERVAEARIVLLEEDRLSHISRQYWYNINKKIEQTSAMDGDYYHQHFAVAVAPVLQPQEYPDLYHKTHQYPYGCGTDNDDDIDDIREKQKLLTQAAEEYERKLQLDIENDRITREANEQARLKRVEQDRRLQENIERRRLIREKLDDIRLKKAQEAESARVRQLEKEHWTNEKCRLEMEHDKSVAHRVRVAELIVYENKLMHTEELRCRDVIVRATEMDHMGDEDIASYVREQNDRLLYIERNKRAAYLADVFQPYVPYNFRTDQIRLPALHSILSTTAVGVDGSSCSAGVSDNRITVTNGDNGDNGGSSVDCYYHIDTKSMPIPPIYHTSSSTSSSMLEGRDSLMSMLSQFKQKDTLNFTNTQRMNTLASLSVLSKHDPYTGKTKKKSSDTAAAVSAKDSHKHTVPVINGDIRRDLLAMVAAGEEAALSMERDRKCLQSYIDSHAILEDKYYNQAIQPVTRLRSSVESSSIVREFYSQLMSDPAAIDASYDGNRVTREHATVTAHDMGDVGIPVKGKKKSMRRKSDRGIELSHRQIDELPPYYSKPFGIKGKVYDIKELHPMHEKASKVKPLSKTTTAAAATTQHKRKVIELTAPTRRVIPPISSSSLDASSFHTNFSLYGHSDKDFLASFNGIGLQNLSTVSNTFSDEGDSTKGNSTPGQQSPKPKHKPSSGSRNESRGSSNVPAIVASHDDTFTLSGSHVSSSNHANTPASSKRSINYIGQLNDSISKTNSVDNIIDDSVFASRSAGSSRVIKLPQSKESI